MKKPISFLILGMVFITTMAQNIRHPFLYSVEERSGPVQLSEGELKIDSILCFTMTAPEDSLLSEVCIYSYDVRGNRTLAERVQNLSGNDQPGERSMISRFVYSWNGNDLITESRMKVPDEDYEMQTNYFYDEADILTAESYFWSHDYTNWDSLGHREIEYDPGGRVCTETVLGSCGNKKEEYLYDIQGRDSLYLEYNAEESTDPQWIIAAKEEFFYDEEGRWIQRISYFDGGPGLSKTLMTVWVYSEGLLTLIQRQYYNPDGAEYLATQEEYQYNDLDLVSDIYDNQLGGDSWVPVKHRYFEYNAENRLVLHETSYKETDWTPFSRIEYVYDEQGCLLAERFFYYNEVWQMNNGDYYFYSALQTEDALSFEALNIKVYPIPSSGVIYFEGIEGGNAEMRLFNLQGELIMSRNMNSGGLTEFNINEAGLYILVIEYRDGSTESRKILIK